MKGRIARSCIIACNSNANQKSRLALPTDHENLAADVRIKLALLI